MAEAGFYALFLTGLLGGGHCVSMCGGIVAAMSLQGGQRQPFRFHLAYNAGRITSYMLAGTLAGLLGSGAFLSAHLLPVEKALFIVAQSMIILLGLYLAGFSQGVRVIERAGAGLWRRLQPLLGKVLPVRNSGQALAAGALWGWLPCGMVYSALIVALASGSAGRGALLMLAFALGTLPNLLLMGWAADSLRAFTRHPWVRRLAGLAVIGLGVWGLMHAGL
jgi:sulfite exporter TauE/SafE